ncbi:hypothetical protein HMPREF0972_02573 [Actinomyces sp. oral taxon 848 str. F0332]|nr:hypothetical protein HMPREF0972_02573 [Actinomyces sp. oral taxon 848 str. F0332]
MCHGRTAADVAPPQGAARIELQARFAFAAGVGRIATKPCVVFSADTRMADPGNPTGPCVSFDASKGVVPGRIGRRRPRASGNVAAHRLVLE